MSASPSRSEKILRDVLNSAPPSPTPKHRRRHSTPVSIPRCEKDCESDLVMSPHEQVLRVRLERVLSERAHSRSCSRSRSQSQDSPTANTFLTPPPTPPRTHTSAASSISSAESTPPMPATPSPVPPPTPSRQFNARVASLQCRLIDGYVSFGAVEGLGMPPDPPEEHIKEDPSWRRVWRWVS